MEARTAPLTHLTHVSDPPRVRVTDRFGWQWTVWDCVTEAGRFVRVAHQAERARVRVFVHQDGVTKRAHRRVPGESFAFTLDALGAQFFHAPFLVIGPEYRVDEYAPGCRPVSRSAP